MYVKTKYIAPAIEIVEIIPETPVLTHSGVDIGVGDWDESGGDFGGSAE